MFFTLCMGIFVYALRIVEATIPVSTIIVVRIS